MTAPPRLTPEREQEIRHSLAALERIGHKTSAAVLRDLLAEIDRLRARCAELEQERDDLADALDTYIEDDSLALMKALAAWRDRHKDTAA